MSRHIVPGWTSVIAAFERNRRDAADQAAFERELSGMRQSAEFFQHALQLSGHFYYASGPTVEKIVLEQLSPAARRAITSPWPTSDQMRQEIWGDDHE